ncbi:hypothetical protein BDP27DRAFT_1450122 [Rhodocollybia butyracea]|uniref:F-box domain-containing protein n=1 Tax=Rhodocollybia butyracea TaxID=206335 RepID=A0A9P5U3F4_9AGAR|nr:hypothetical protein BDP27DRAFT_1450122 [Rhodocollybia butyracea]
MTPPRPKRCPNPLWVRVNLSSEELSTLYDELRFEFGPSVVTLERANGLRTMLALADKDIEDHALEVACLTDSEQRMIVQTEQKRLETQRAVLLSLLSPMRKLPNETLLRIFKHVCEDNHLQCYPWIELYYPFSRISHPNTMSSRALTYLPTMAIGSVCSRWRALALSSPTLWANLTVEICTVKGSQVEHLTGFIDNVTLYLERSGDWPLRLSLIIRGNGEEIPSLIQIKRHAWRWKTLKYQEDCFLTGKRIFSQLRFPLLVELDLGGWGSHPEPDVLDCFEFCPKLRALTVTWPWPASKVPYNQLDYINFGHGQSKTGWMEALRICSHLKSFEMGGYNLEEGGLGTCANANVASFSLATASNSTDTVLSSLNLPSLNNLVLDGPGGSWRTDTFISFVSRSSCTITTFALHRISVSDLDLIAAFRVMPALLHFEVNQYGPSENPFTSHLISSLTHHQSTSIPLVPKLHSLRLKLPTDAFDDAAFVNMVHSRWFKPGSGLSAEMLAKGKGCIRSVVLKFTSREVNAEIYKPLQILDAEGLRVVISGTNGVQV